MDRQQAIEAARQFWEIWDELSLVYEAYARKLGISTPTLLVLDEVYHTQGCTQRDICRATLMPKQTVNSIVADLVREGVLELTPSPSDRRAKLVCLTEKGKSFAQRVIDPEDRAEADVFSELSSEQWDQVFGMMQRISKSYRTNMLGDNGE